MARLHVLRVFCAEDGSGGNPLGVFLDGDEIAVGRRQAVATDLGFAETVFVDDRRSGEIRIFTPTIELPLAGHPLVGSAWLLAREGESVPALRPPAGEVAVRFADGLTWVTADPEWGPAWELREAGSPGEVDALDGPPEDAGEVAVWAWIDRDAGLVRQRVFAHEVGVVEDEATGSAALRLTAAVGRAIEIRQGKGSVLLAAPRGEGMATVGGRVELDEVVDY